MLWPAGQVLFIHSHQVKKIKPGKLVLASSYSYLLGRGTPTPGSWPGVDGGDYSDMGVWNKCLDCANEKSKFPKWVIYTQQNYMRLRFYWMNEEDQWRGYKYKGKHIFCTDCAATPQNLWIQIFWSCFLYFSGLQSSWLATVSEYGEF